MALTKWKESQGVWSRWDGEDTCGCGTWVHSAAEGLAVVEEWLDLLVSESFSHTNSMIPW